MSVLIGNALGPVEEPEHPQEHPEFDLDEEEARDLIDLAVHFESAIIGVDNATRLLQLREQYDIPLEERHLSRLTIAINLGQPTILLPQLRTPRDYPLGTRIIMRPEAGFRTYVNREVAGHIPAGDETPVFVVAGEPGRDNQGCFTLMPLHLPLFFTHPEFDFMMRGSRGIGFTHQGRLFLEAGIDLMQLRSEAELRHFGNAMRTFGFSPQLNYGKNPRYRS